MAIYQLFEAIKQEKVQDKAAFTETFDVHVKEAPPKGRFFSTLVTRFCFFFLLVADLAWGVYGFLTLLFGLITFSKKTIAKGYLNFRRSLVCGLSLFLGLFSPPFGIMVACTYFLMYDKAGIEEVVPGPFQAQFRDLFKS